MPSELATIPPDLEVTGSFPQEFNGALASLAPDPTGPDSSTFSWEVEDSSSSPSGRSSEFSEGKRLERGVSERIHSLGLPRKQPPPLDKTVVRQMWEGVVLDVLEESFVARLSDVLGQGPTSEAEIYTEELSPSDRKLLAPGAVFYWSIGYRDTKAGERRRESSIVFRALPRWRAPELKAASDRAKESLAELGWD